LNLDAYIVGGAVRDELLGLPVNDRDWVVVGSTPEDMVRRGFKPVGKDFPVFIQPTSGEEYALARTERKTAKGYHGFTFHATAEVTLEEDLSRRDLTINAIAKSPDGTLIDPHHGIDDLKAKLFRHVSDAFKEDPVRILRVARFAARFSDFQVHPSTNALMQAMVDNGEVDSLVAERVWQELAKGLMENTPSRMLTVLHDCGALSKLLASVDEPALQVLNSQLDSAAHSALTLPERFALIAPHLGSKRLAALRLPTDVADLANLVIAIGDELGRAPRNAHSHSQLLQRCDVTRRPQRFQGLLNVLRIDQPAFKNNQSLWQTSARAFQSINAGEIATRLAMQNKAASGDAIKKAVAQAREEAVASALKNFALQQLDDTPS
jgi:tRNA nucleotidyltransferase (CCA-adding enzyme)